MRLRLGATVGLRHIAGRYRLHIKLRPLANCLDSYFIGETSNKGTIILNSNYRLTLGLIFGPQINS